MAKQINIYYFFLPLLIKISLLEDTLTIMEFEKYQDMSIIHRCFSSLSVWRLRPWIGRNGSERKGTEYHKHWGKDFCSFDFEAIFWGRQQLFEVSRMLSRIMSVLLSNLKTKERCWKTVIIIYIYTYTTAIAGSHARNMIKYSIIYGNRIKMWSVLLYCVLLTGKYTEKQTIHYNVMLELSASEFKSAGR